MDLIYHETSIHIQISEWSKSLSLDSLSGVNFDSRQNHLNQGRIGGFPLGLVEAGRKKNIKNTSSKKKIFFMKYNYHIVWIRSVCTRFEKNSI